jgi:K+-sensing histidine kinase KdpD
MMADASPNVMVPGKTVSPSPLEQLLHALNQPLTGLQCSMEVALTRPRTVEQYVQTLHQGLKLTECIRTLVEAIREVADIGEDQASQTETTELATLVREAVETLSRVAHAKKVRIVLDFPYSSLFVVTARKSPLGCVIFRLLDSTLSMAASGTSLRIETGSATNQVWVRIQWQAEGPRSEFSRPELGLLIAQVALKRVGAGWARQASDGVETLTVQLPRFS